MSNTVLLAAGITCLALTVALAWYSLSPIAVRRRGFDPDHRSGDLSDEQHDAFVSYLGQLGFLAFATVVLGLAGVILVTVVWHDFPWVGLAACVGWSAWMVNEVRLGRRRFTA